jgi:hypothetical protein
VFIFIDCTVYRIHTGNRISLHRSNTRHCWCKYLKMVLFRAATSRAAAQAVSSQCLRAQISPLACRRLPFKYSQLSRALTTSSNRKVKVLAVLYEVSIFVIPYYPRINSRRIPHPKEKSTLFTSANNQLNCRVVSTPSRNHVSSARPKTSLGYANGLRIRVIP